MVCIKTNKQQQQQKIPGYTSITCAMKIIKNMKFQKATINKLWVHLTLDIRITKNMKFH